MVPRIADRGHSFKGAGLYYLHDKKAQTSDRVAWTYTHNIPTRDPEKAFNWMAYTAMNANRLKRQSGVPATGRKSRAGTVYSFSLAWHPEQQPDQQTMMEAALTTLGLLKLSDHEAVFVAHTDREHPHVHVICNLVHPETGKMAVPSYDRLTMSAWAEQVERNDGEILCEQRVINNERRRRSPQQNRQFELVKHRETKLIDAKRIEELYIGSDSGKAFQAALANEGYTLAKGDRRGFVLVDTAGKIYSLSRQLKGQRAADVTTRLKNLDSLPKAADLSLTRKEYHKMQQDTEASIQATLLQQEQERKDLLQQEQEHATRLYLDRLDALRAWEEKTARQKAQLEQEQQKQYRRDEITGKIKSLEEQLAKATPLDKLTGRQQKLTLELDNLKKTLDTINQRIEEQNQAFDLKAQESKPDVSRDDDTVQNRAEYIRGKLQRPGRSNNRGNEPGQEP